MIQRIQTIYLLIAAIATTALLFIPIGYIYNNLYGLIYTPFVVKDITADAGVAATTFYIGILLALSSVLSLITIFTYKNRMRQVQLVYVNMLIIIVNLILTVYIYPEWIFTKKNIIQNTEEIQYNLWIFACYIPAAIMFFLANQAIKKDERLVRAADRLR